MKTDLISKAIEAALDLQRDGYDPGTARVLVLSALEKVGDDASELLRTAYEEAEALEKAGESGTPAQSTPATRDERLRAQYLADPTYVSI